MFISIKDGGNIPCAATSRFVLSEKYQALPWKVAAIVETETTPIFLYSHPQFSQYVFFFWEGKQRRALITDVRIAMNGKILAEGSMERGHISRKEHV